MVFRHDEADSGKERQKEKDDEWIADRNGKAREHVVPKGSSFSASLVRCGRFCVIGIGTKAKEQDTAQQLEIEHGSWTFDEVHHETHAESGYHGIDEVAQRCPDACGKAVPTPLVESTLHGKHPDWSHRRTCHYSHHQTPHSKVDGAD